MITFLVGYVMGAGLGIAGYMLWNRQSVQDKATSLFGKMKAALKDARNTDNDTGGFE